MKLTDGEKEDLINFPGVLWRLALHHCSIGDVALGQQKNFVSRRLSATPNRSLFLRV
jgi:hypothetical protein